jgi:hypothetical protein
MNDFSLEPKRTNGFVYSVCRCTVDACLCRTCLTWSGICTVNEWLSQLYRSMRRIRKATAQDCLGYTLPIITPDCYTWVDTRTIDTKSPNRPEANVRIGWPEMCPDCVAMKCKDCSETFSEEDKALRQKTFISNFYAEMEQGAYVVLGSYLHSHLGRTWAVPTVGKAKPHAWLEPTVYPRWETIKGQWWITKVVTHHATYPKHLDEMERKKTPTPSNRVLQSLPVRVATDEGRKWSWGWKRISVAPVITPERKTWKGVLLLPATNDQPAVYASGGRRLWARKWTAKELPGLDTTEQVAALRDWRDRLHQTGVYIVRSVDTLTSRKRKAYLRRHPVTSATTITYRLPLGKLGPVKNPTL